ncbi:tripartite tricarboxylate transporter substrate binding protein [Pusillimonas sp. SM2304]|uniref:tripartite tricarboxylate transporter substrate binding protein n=1 Tax=Pusillimonas sp. SM2304 TaxID=3073241 RepID=UPI00287550BD|nr:tripartite tricarboxylate transporter substrate binding protein [Pusillimonas sp. SM2304]MDS1139437.1 tripartite tricarboxylate transporter substrate binding protein [Pusillimonas sp. SM2304]
MNIYSKAVTSLFVALAGVLGGHHAAAAAYPDRPIKIIVPFTAGGVVDQIARSIGEKLSQKYGQPVIVDNKAGASGAIGTETAMSAPPDGYTLLCVSPGHVILPPLAKKPKWDPNNDFRGIHGFGEIPNVIAVPASLPVKTIGDLISLAKEREADPLTFASPGMGTSIHLAGVMLAQQASINLTHVPYRGQPDAMTDLIAGRVDMMPLSSPLAKPHIDSGKLRGLAVTTSYESSLLPGIPALAKEAGLPDYQASTWFGFVTQAKVPDGIVEQLSNDIAGILKMPDVQQQFSTLGLELTPRDHAQFDIFVDQEYEKWKAVIEEGKLQID